MRALGYTFFMYTNYLPLLIKKSTTILYRDEARSLDPLALSLTHTDSLSQS